MLSALDLTLAPGEFVALLGPNGTGKTTLIRVLASLSRIHAGEVVVASHPLPAQADRARRKIGLVSHQPLLYQDLTAEENLWFYGRIYQVKDFRRRAQEVLDLVGLRHRRDDLVRTFSRGMQQRLAIARAVLHQPRVLLLDEPHTGLDQEAGQQLDVILREQSDRGRTILMASHDLARAAGLASRIAVLSRGKITASRKVAGLAGEGLLQFYREALETEGRGI